MRPRQILFVAVAALSAAALLLFVDLTPRVDETFFFSSDDPQVREDARLRELFPDRPQVIVSARGDIHSAEYGRRLDRLANDLAAVDGVRRVQDIHRGPPEAEDAFQGPLWRRLLIAEDESATNVLLTLESRGYGATIPAIESVVERHRGEGFDLAVSGVPFVVEQIRRQSLRDLKVFGVAVVLVFALVTALFYRSGWIVLGTMVAAGTASTLTLLVRPLLGLEPDLLTPNITSIVFVVTLSFVVYITAEWRSAALGGAGDAAVSKAIRWTGTASLLGMLTALLGFLSLLLATAKPVRSFGLSCSIGTVLALAAAYGIYPAFLASADPRKVVAPSMDRAMAKLFERRHDALVVALLAGAVLTVPGLWRLNTDPSLFDYFAEGTELRSGLEGVDAAGGSNPVEIVIRDAGGEPLSEDEVFERMWALQADLENDSDVGAVVSLPALMQEAEEQTPWYAELFVDDEDRLQELQKPKHDRVARSFVTEDLSQGRFILRMKESARRQPRAEVVARLEDTVRRHGFEPVVTGGLYPLQGHLADLVGSSLLSGLAGLVAVFALIAFLVARSAGLAAAMILSFLMIPIPLLGILGYLRTPQDIISVSAADVALGLAIDDMIHTVSHIRRARGGKKGPFAWEDWVAARRDLWRATVGGSTIVIVGFSLLFLSIFPPTRRLGLSVALGTTISLTVVLFVLPRIAVALQRKR